MNIFPPPPQYKKLKKNEIQNFEPKKIARSYVCVKMSESPLGPPPPMKNDKNVGFLGNTGSDPLKDHSHQVSIQFWVNIDTPAKRLNGVSLAGR